MPRKRQSRSTNVNSVREKHESAIMQIPGVTGIGVGESGPRGDPTLKIYVDRMTPELRKRLPKELEGYPVVAEESGEFKAL
jgi:hypothetical protein